MTRSDRVFRVLVRLGIASATAACGLGLAGELVVPGDPGTGGSGINSRQGQGGDDSGDASGSDADDLGTDGASGFDPDGSLTGDDSGSTGSSSGGPAHGGGEAGPIPTMPCNFNGTWATKLTIPVNWVPQGIMSVILQPGSGTIDQWIMQSRVQNGTTLTDTTVVCGIDLPDFTGTVVAGAEAYGVRFPDSLFDDNYLPTFIINGTLSAATTNAQ